MITNKQNLPEAFMNFAKSDSSHPFVQNRFSVTELLGSPREIILNRRYREQIDIDVVDLIPALFGTAVHSILEANAPQDVLSEVSLSWDVDGYEIVGRCDVLNLLEQSVEDYKTGKCSKIQQQDFEDWRLQGLAYAWGAFIKYNVIIRHLKFTCLLKDWSKLKAAVSTNYPKSPVYVWEYKVEDSDYDYIKKYIRDKLKAIKEGEKDLPECSDAEKWYTGDAYAVYRNKEDAKAIRVFAFESEARDYITNKLSGVGEIVKRAGENLKCKYYCNCAEFCRKESGEK